MSKTKETTATLVSAKQLAQDLGVTDALVKKLIKDFGIETEKVKNRTSLNNEGVEVMKTILKLKANGAKTSEIKEMFLASKAPQADTASETSAKTTKSSSKKEDSKAKDKKDSKASKSKKEEAEASKTKAKKEDSKARSKDKPKGKKEDPKASKPKSTKEDSEADELGDLEEKAKEEGLDISDFIKDEVSEQHDDSLLEEALSMDEADELDLDEDIDESEDFEEPSAGKEKLRRRRFNFRYVQRQIAHDTRKVNFLKHKLNRSNLSTADREATRDALDRRAKLLNGWIHLLRWIKSN